MNRTGRIALLIAALAAMSFVWNPFVDAVSMRVESRMLRDGKSVSTSGTMAYEAASGLLVVHFQKPVENWWIINAKGELRVYDPLKKTVNMQQQAALTSQAGYLYSFIVGETGDMGLRKAGLSPSDTRSEDGLVITTWSPSTMLTGAVSRVELVHEQNVPIYSGWYDMKQQLVLKVYYSDFIREQGILFPRQVTEINFRSPTDSTIERKQYSDFRFNEGADESLLRFQIPADAKVITH